MARRLIKIGTFYADSPEFFAAVNVACDPATYPDSGGSGGIELFPVGKGQVLLCYWEYF